MSGFLSSDIIADAKALLAKHHETWAVHTIVAYQTAKPTIVSENPNFNFLYNDNTNNQNITYETITGQFNVRVKFPDEQEVNPFITKQERKSEDQLNVGVKAGMVRIKIDPTGAAFVRNAERVILKNKIYRFDSDDKPSGFLSDQFFIFYLKQLN